MHLLHDTSIVGGVDPPRMHGIYASRGICEDTHGFILVHSNKKAQDSALCLACRKTRNREGTGATALKISGW